MRCGARAAEFGAFKISITILKKKRCGAHAAKFEIFKISTKILKSKAAGLRPDPVIVCLNAHRAP